MSHTQAPSGPQIPFVETVKSKVEILQNFVASSEYMNFTEQLHDEFRGFFCKMVLHMVLLKLH